MEQLTLTNEQLELLEKMKSLFNEAEEKGIKFVYDTDDASLSAFNASNASSCYTDSDFYEDDCGKKMDWDKCSIVNSWGIYYMNSAFENFYLEFE